MAFLVPSDDQRGPRPATKTWSRRSSSTTGGRAKSVDGALVGRGSQIRLLRSGLHASAAESTTGIAGKFHDALAKLGWLAPNDRSEGAPHPPAMR